MGRKTSLEPLARRVEHNFEQNSLFEAVLITIHVRETRSSYRGGTLTQRELLEFDGRANFCQLSFDLLSIFLGGAFLDLSRNSFD